MWRRSLIKQVFGISPVIATSLMLAIVVIVSSFAVSWAIPMVNQKKAEAEFDRALYETEVLNERLNDNIYGELGSSVSGKINLGENGVMSLDSSGNRLVYYYPTSDGYNFSVSDLDDEDNELGLSMHEGECTKAIVHWNIDNVQSGDTCFLPGTKVLMADGSFKNIEDIGVGDFVKSFDLNQNLKVDGRVTKVFSHASVEMDDYYLKINNDLCVTSNHRFYSNDKWVEAGSLQVKDKLFSSNIGSEVFVKSIDKIFDRQPSYDLSVENVHNYFVKINDECVLVHNDDVDQQQSHQTNDWPIYLDGKNKISSWGSQSFRPSQAVLSKVDVYVKKVGTAVETPLVVEIRENSAIGSRLATASRNPEEITADYSWVSFDFTDFEVNVGDTYFIRVFTESGDSKNCYIWGFNAEGGYDDGSFWYSKSFGEQWIERPFFDFCFKTYNPSAGNQPPSIDDYSPADGATNVGVVSGTNVDVDLRVTASDSDSEELTVDYYHVTQFGDVKLGSGSGSPGGWIDFDWNGLSYNTAYTWKFSVSDGDGNLVWSDEYSFTTRVNNPPVGVGDSYNVNQGGTLTVSTPGVLGNDEDLDYHNLVSVYVDGSGPSHHSSFKLNEDGSFNYVHNGDDSASDSFVYKAYDGIDYSDSTTVSISINSDDESPTIQDYSPADGATGVGIDAGSSVSVPLSVTASDSDSEELTVDYYNISGMTQSKIGSNSGPSGSKIEYVWSGLSYNTAYTWKFSVSDDSNTVWSDEYSFTTRAESSALDVTTNNSIVNEDDVVMYGYLADLGSAETGVEVYFKYQKDSGGSGSTFPSETDHQTLNSPGEFFAPVLDLSEGDYDYWAVAKSSLDTDTGDVLQFTIGGGVSEPPTVTTNDSMVDGDKVTMRGYLSDLGSASGVKVYFKYQKVSGGEGIVIPLETDNETLYGPDEFAFEVTGLSDGDYEYWAVAEGDGTDEGFVDYFTIGTTITPPTVVTNGSYIRDDVVVLKGYLNDLGSADDVDVYFCYKPKGAVVVPEKTSVQNFNGPQEFYAELSGLDAGLYEFWAVAEGNGTDRGDVLEFTVEITHVPPTVKTESVNIYGYFVTFYGNLEDMGSADSVDVSFRYRFKGSSNGPFETVEEPMTATGLFDFKHSLDPGDYEFWAFAKNSASPDENDTGEPMYFTIVGTDQIYNLTPTLTPSNSPRSIFGYRPKHIEGQWDPFNGNTGDYSSNGADDSTERNFVVTSSDYSMGVCVDLYNSSSSGDDVLFGRIWIFNQGRSELSVGGSDKKVVSEGGCVLSGSGSNWFLNRDPLFVSSDGSLDVVVSQFIPEGGVRQMVSGDSCSFVARLTTSSVRDLRNLQNGFFRIQVHGDNLAATVSDFLRKESGFRWSGGELVCTDVLTDFSIHQSIFTVKLK